MGTLGERARFEGTGVTSEDLGRVERIRALSRTFLSYHHRQQIRRAVGRYRTSGSLQRLRPQQLEPIHLQSRSLLLNPQNLRSQRRLKRRKKRSGKRSGQGLKRSRPGRRTRINPGEIGSRSLPNRWTSLHVTLPIGHGLRLLALQRIGGYHFFAEPATSRWSYDSGNRIFQGRLRGRNSLEARFGLATTIDLQKVSEKAKSRDLRGSQLNLLVRPRLGGVVTSQGRRQHPRGQCRLRRRRTDPSRLILSSESCTKDRKERVY